MARGLLGAGVGSGVRRCVGDDIRAGIGRGICGTVGTRVGGRIPCRIHSRTVWSSISWPTDGGVLIILEFQSDVTGCGRCGTHTCGSRGLLYALAMRYLLAAATLACRTLLVCSPLGPEARTALGLALLATTGCATVAPLSVRPSGTELIALAPCAPPVVPPTLEDSRFIPSLSGDLTLVRAEGDERLSTEDPVIVTAWSPDSALVAFIDYGTISVWQRRQARRSDSMCAREV
jgi:hypothetical protein